MDIIEQLAAIFIGHANVGDHRIEIDLVQQPFRFRDMTGGAHLITVFSKNGGQHPQRIRFVVDHQHPALAHDCPCPAKSPTSAGNSRRTRVPSLSALTISKRPP